MRQRHRAASAARCRFFARSRFGAGGRSCEAAVLPVPSLGPRVLLGKQGARELAEANQRVLPAKLAERGHRFRQSEVEGALAHELGHDPG